MTELVPLPFDDPRAARALAGKTGAARTSVPADAVSVPTDDGSVPAAAEADRLEARP